MTPTTFVVSAPDLGAFEVKRRTLAVQMAIHAELNRLTEGAPLPTLSDWFIDLCALVAELRVLIVKAPDGWSLDDVDPLDNGYDQLRQVHQAIREQESRFRAERKGHQAPGAGPGQEPAMVVSGTVSPAAK